VACSSAASEGGLILNHKTLYNTVVRRTGLTFQNLTTDTKVQGALQPNGPAIFRHDADINNGDVLRDQQGIAYIIDFIKNDLDHKTVCLVETSLYCDIYRPADGPRDAFGKPVDEPVLIKTGVPIAMHTGQKRCQLPTTIDVKQGDMISIPKNSDTYRVQAVSRVNSAGVVELAITRQDITEMLSKM
jgi:hypothetical protein